MAFSQQTLCTFSEMVPKYPTGPSYTYTVKMTFPFPITKLPTSLADTAFQWKYKDETDTQLTETSTPTTFYVDEAQSIACTVSGQTLDCPCKH